MLLNGYICKVDNIFKENYNNFSLIRLEVGGFYERD